MVYRRAFFIVPPTGLFYRDDRCQVSLKGVSNAPRPPLDMAYMSAMLEETGERLCPEVERSVRPKCVQNMHDESATPAPAIPR